MTEFEFPPQLPWINADAPLRLRHELRGHVVLLHFWTSTCIHCLHVLADLQHLQKKFAGRPFVVIGVHVAKYCNDERAIRAALSRNHILHPMMIDTERAVWEAFGVRTWPTMVLLGADGKTVGSISGEGHRTLLEHSIDRALKAANDAGNLAVTPLAYRATDSISPQDALAYPEKILADAERNRLIVVDSGHHRILITTWPDSDANVTVEWIIGTGKPGMADGDFGAAVFNSPEGATLGGGRGGTDILWIADTGNHSVRRIDLAAQRVVTVLGTGVCEFDNEAGKSGREQALNSPRDVAIFGNRLYVSQAGQHQIFAMNLMTGMTEVAAGAARENLRDGEATRAYLAQPSGLAMDASRQILYFADAENSAVRALDLQKKQVSTIVGRGLFEFGDVDGDLNTARLQHCTGLALSGDGTQLMVADTGNHKIKIIDLAARTVKTLGGGGGELFEPASVAVSNRAGIQELFVADTNHHRIMRVNPATGAWKELTFHGAVKV